MIYVKSDNLIDQIVMIQEMHMPDASVTDVSRNFAEYVNRVAYRGERFTLMRGGKPVAELVPFKPGLPRGVPIEDLPRIFASLPRLSDEEWESFAADIEAGRPTASEDDFRDPWES